VIEYETKGVSPFRTFSGRLVPDPSASEEPTSVDAAVKSNTSEN